jgi:hypothetical protein
MAQQPDDIIVIQRILKLLKENYQNIGDTLISGGVDNMEKYKYMLGQAHAYQYISQEISNLLNNKEQRMNKEETLLTSDKSQEVPKIKLALEEKYEKEKER